MYNWQLHIVYHEEFKQKKCHPQSHLQMFSHDSSHAMNAYVFFQLVAWVYTIVKTRSTQYLQSGELMYMLYFYKIKQNVLMFLRL